MRTVVDDIARHDPAAIAVTTPRGHLTYGELTTRIDALADALRAHGARAETVCAVAVDPGVDAVVAMAAALRAGTAFLTLDVTQPPARLAALVRTGRATLLLTTAALAERLALPVEGPTVLLDRPPTRRDPRPAATVGPRSLAYVSHTSGSTGEPSAVLIEHAGLDSYLRFVVRDFGLGPQTVVLQVAPLGYDASVRDILAPLLAGGRLVLVPRSTLLRPSGFGAAVREYGANTVLSATPSLLAFLRGEPEAAALSTLDLVASSGESLRPFLTAGGRALIGGRLVNQYGPTECTMTATRYAVPDQPPTGPDVVGTPIDGMVVRLLDGHLRPVAEGAVGEVFLGGTGVARGYGWRPRATAETFLPDPLGPPGTRLYRTGDLARHTPDGLCYLGRTDRQVKIRGYRVDPAEVEGALLTHPAITGAVVTPDHDERGRVFLVAHVVGDLAGTTDRALRAHLARTLPPHLMPRRFERHTTLPLTRSGKTDRRALAAAVTR
jgi:D-alanine--poly(phosphoribitol) ligase subunit 1